MNLRQRIGKRIQELRIMNHLKQSDLAEIVGIATKTQSCIETGRNLPSAELFEKYANALNIDESVLFEISHIKEPEALLNEIYNILSNASSKQIQIIYKLVKDVVLQY